MQEVLIKKKMSINDLNVNTSFYQENIDTIFIPLLKELSEMQKKKNRRLTVFIAAAPGTGKSTFAAFLEDLSGQVEGISKAQAVGIDGFHFTNRYLEEHHVDNDPRKPLLKTVKGSPISYDVEKLRRYLKGIASQDILWPVYSRINHDVNNNGITVNQKIVLLEGNYLLLETAPWRSLSEYADYTIFLKADTSLLKQHLIERKFAGGATMHEAEAHYLNTDAANVAVVNEHSTKADLTLTIDTNMKYHKISNPFSCI